MSLQEEEESFVTSKTLSLDGLYCEEPATFEEEDDYNPFINNGVSHIIEKQQPFSFVLSQQHDLYWDDNELVSLISKEKESYFNGFESFVFDGSLMVSRKEAVEWILNVKRHYGFTALTCVLAVNYFDRFVSGFKFQRDKPWMVQLVAVACLSLAAKVDETHVPLLLDLQVEESKYVFEAKTIYRMELLVLSTLQWRMNPVTPISFFDHIVRRLGLKSQLHWEFLLRCENLLLSIIVDSRFTVYLPSTLATATMLHVIKELEPCNQLEYQKQLINVLKYNEDQVNVCYKLILEISGNQKKSSKGKRMLTPGSPNGIIDASFGSDSSNDSWDVAPTVLTSPMPPFKRSRLEDQHLQKLSLNSMFVDVLSSPY